MLEGIGPIHLIFVLVIALIVVGPGKLPEVGGAIGKSIREFRKASAGDDTPAAAPAPVALAPVAPPPAPVLEPAPVAQPPAAPVAAAPIAAPVVAASVAAAPAPVAVEPAPVPVLPVDALVAPPTPTVAVAPDQGPPSVPPAG